MADHIITDNPSTAEKIPSGFSFSFTKAPSFPAPVPSGRKPFSSSVPNIVGTDDSHTQPSSDFSTFSYRPSDTQPNGANNRIAAPSTPRPRRTADFPDSQEEPLDTHDAQLSSGRDDFRSLSVLGKDAPTQTSLGTPKFCPARIANSVPPSSTSRKDARILKTPLPSSFTKRPLGSTLTSSSSSSTSARLRERLNKSFSGNSVGKETTSSNSNSDSFSIPDPPITSSHQSTSLAVEQNTTAPLDFDTKGRDARFIPHSSSSRNTDSIPRHLSHSDRSTPRDRSVSVAASTASRGGGIPVLNPIQQEIGRVLEQNATLKAENDALGTRVEDLEREKEDLEMSKSTLREKSVAALREANERMSALNTQHDELRNISAAHEKLFRELVVDKTELTTFRDHVSKSLEGLEALLDDSSGLPEFVSVDRQLVDDIRQDAQTLRLDCEKKQQVIDLLRERLEINAGDLSECRDRFFNLESQLNQARGRLDSALEEAKSSDSSVRQLAVKLERQQGDEVISCARIEGLEEECKSLRVEIATNNSKCAHLEQINSDLRDAIFAAEKNKYRFHELEMQVPALQARIEALKSVESSLATKDERIADLLLRLRQLEPCEGLLSQAREELSASRVAEAAAKSAHDGLQIASNQLNELRAEVSRLQFVAGSVAAREEDLRSVTKQYEVEKVAKVQALRDAEAANKRLESFEQELISLQGKLNRSNARCELSEQRRLDQETSLRTQVDDLLGQKATLESRLVATMKEQMVASERAAGLAASLAGLQSTSDREASLLRTGAQSLTDRLSEKDVENLNLQALCRSLQERLETQTSQQNLERLRAAELEEECRTLKDDVARRPATQLSTVVAAAAEVDTLRAYVKDLSDQLRQSAETVQDQENAVRTMVARFRASETLPEHEANLIREVYQLSHERYKAEIITKDTQLKSRETLVASLTERITQLEEVLKKALDSQQPEGTTSVEEEQAVIRPSTPVADPSRDQVTTDPTPPSPPSPPRVSRPIQYASYGTGSRPSALARPAALNARRAFAEIEQRSSSSIEQSAEDVFGGEAGPSTALKQQLRQEVGVKKRAKRTHDDMEYDEVEEEPKQPAKAKKVAGRPSVATSSAKAAATPAQKRGKKRR